MKENAPQTVVEVLIQHLENVGVDVAFGVSGAFIAPAWKALFESSINTIHCRHETGAAFCASEYSLYKNKPAAVFSTAGPGITNALTALRAAKLDGSKVVFIAPITTSKNNGLWGLQQTTAQDVSALAGDGITGFFDRIVCIDEEEKVYEAIEAISHLKTSRSQVLGIFILPSVQKKMFFQDEVKINKQTIHPSKKEEERYLEKQQHKIAEVLATGDAIIWNGFGCNHCSEILTRLATETYTPVMSTPRGKGIFPERHPLYIGATGLGSDEQKLQSIVNDPSLKAVIILGTRLGESSSHYLQNKIKDIDVYYVSLENADIRKNLPASTVVINTELSQFLHGVYDKIKKLPIAHQSNILENQRAVERQTITEIKNGVIHPQDVMAIIQKVAIDEYDCLVAADAGNSHVWTNRYLQFQKPNRYRVNSALGTMGHYACGIVGLAMSGKVTVGVIGDGSMLMNNEISTAVHHQAPAIWLVLNDGTYNMCRQGLNSIGYPQLDCAIPQVDFALFAQALGANGIRVTHSSELETALHSAIMQSVPTVIDVLIDREAPPPVFGRNKTVKSL